MITKDTQPDQQMGCRLQSYVWMILLALFQLGALLNGLQRPTSIQTTLPMPFEVVGAALWTGLFLLAAVLLRRGRVNAKRAALSIFIAFVCYNLLRWFAFTKADYDRERLPVLLIASCIVILSAALIGLRREQPLGTEKRTDDPELTN